MTRAVLAFAVLGALCLGWLLAAMVVGAMTGWRMDGLP